MGAPFQNPQFGPINPKTRKPWAKEAIDERKSQVWALAQLGSIGLGPWSRSTYDLVNRLTNRGHRMYVNAVGGSKGSPITGQFTSSDYLYFSTQRPVNFDDFDYCAVAQKAVNLIFWTSSSLIVWDGQLPMGDKLIDLDTSGFGLSLPSAGGEGGFTSIVYGNGVPADPVIPEIEFDLPPGPEKLDPRIKLSQKADTLVIEIQGDALFDFDDIKILKEAEKVLSQAGAIIKANADRSVNIVGHTDSMAGQYVDPVKYNMNLSQQRALAVEIWLRDRRYISQKVHAEGVGFSQPKAPNSINGKDNPSGRQMNRRVEIALIKRRA